MSSWLLLWIELKFLARRGLRVLAGLLLVLAVLNAGLGDSMVLAAPSTSSLDGAKLVHLQMFGGVIHLHDAHVPGEHSHAKHQKNPTGSLVKLGFDADLFNFSARAGLTTLTAGDSSAISLLISSKYQGGVGLAGLERFVFLGRRLALDMAQLPDPFIFPPVKPPIGL
jgi:hypothetical protein